MYASEIPPRSARDTAEIYASERPVVHVYQTLPAALGVSSRLGLAMNSITVRRPPGEAAGAICKLISDSAPPLVINVEYNQLDALLRENGGGGDTADGSGYSPYPGNINILIFEVRASRLYLGCISAISRPYLGHISAISHRRGASMRVDSRRGSTYCTNTALIPI